MASIINASSTGSGGIVQTADASGVLQLQTNGTVALTVDTSANVGVSVTPSAWGSPVPKAIQVGTSSLAWGNSDFSSHQTANAFFNGSSWTYVSTAFASLYSQVNGVHSWRTAPSGTAGNAITLTQTLAVGLNESLALQGATSQAGTGITFPATQSASSNANTLDDYEEGTWTPSLGGNTTYGIQAGTYTRIGNVVTAWLDLSVTLLGTGATTNIAGLPYAARTSSYPQGMSGSVGYFFSLATAVTAVLIRVDNNSSTVSCASTTAAQTTVGTSAIFGNNARLTGTITYEVNT